VGNGMVLSMSSAMLGLFLIPNSHRWRTLCRRGGVEPLRILRLRRCAVTLAHGRVALRDRRAHSILMVGWPWRVRHRRLKQSLVVSPGLDELLVELREIIWIKTSIQSSSSQLPGGNTLFLRVLLNELDELRPNC
jgi:hypothetical protein